MPIAFEEIPANILVPLFHAEIKPAFHPFSSSLKLLLVGHKNRADLGGDRGVGAFNTPYLLSGTEATRLFGPGSMLESMYRQARRTRPFIEIWGIAAEPQADGEAATSTVTVVNTASRAGRLRFLLAGRPVEIIVRPTDSKEQIAARLRTHITGNRSLPVTAAIDGADATKINLTCKWRAFSGNDLRMTDRYPGRQNELAGVLSGVGLVAFTGGLGSAGLGGALASLGDMRFDVIACGLRASAGHLFAMRDFMDHSSGRWSTLQQLYGHAIFAARGSFAGLQALGAGHNDPHSSIVGMGEQVPHPIWDWSSAWGAVAAHHWAAPPELSRPLQTLPLPGLLPPAEPQFWFDIAERNTLLAYGIATYTVDPDRMARIERLVTLYKTNVWGDTDASWRDANTLFQAMYFTRYMRGLLTGTFPRAALADEDTGIPGFASPGQIKDMWIHGYKDLEHLGLVENTEAFARALVVERDPLDANRVNCLVRPDMVNQLRIIANLIETHLQLNERNPEIASVDPLE